MTTTRSAAELRSLIAEAGPNSKTIRTLRLELLRVLQAEKNETEEAK